MCVLCFFFDFKKKGAGLSEFLFYNNTTRERESNDRERELLEKKKEPEKNAERKWDGKERGVNLVMC